MSHPPSLHTSICNQLNELLGVEWRAIGIDSGGFSTSSVWRIDAIGPSGGSEYAIKRTDCRSVSFERLTQVHRVQNSVANEVCPFVPGLRRWLDGNTILHVGGYFWEIADWKPGIPISSVGTIAAAQLENGVRTVSRLHRSLRKLGMEFRKSPGLVRRLELFKLLDGSRITQLHRQIETIEDGTTGQELHQILGAVSDRRHVEMLNSLRMQAESVFPCQWIVRDLWREHVLFEGDQVTGLIDFGATQMDWLGLDLVRILGTWLMPHDPMWSTALNWYNNFDEDAKLNLESIVFVDQISCYLSGIQWIEWLSDGELLMSDRASRVRCRVHEIAMRVARFC